jgi:hypothetical protein
MWGKNFKINSLNILMERSIYKNTTIYRKENKQGKKGEDKEE